jgi:ferrochelatase
MMSCDDSQAYDAILLVSFGGPEGPDQVMPFLENVLRGKNVPRERMLEVAEHYQHFGGISPINQQNRALIDALRQELDQHRISLPIYYGNRNWHPTLVEAIQAMAENGVQRALAFFTSMYSCYSGCRQYRENIAEAREVVGPHAPEIHKLRMAFNHPGYIAASAERLAEGRARLLREFPAADSAKLNVVFTAHSIPLSMADHCKYETQLKESCRLIMERHPGLTWQLVYQSRSGPPSQPWLEPDVCDALTELHSADPANSVVILPVGFVSDHMEVLYDLDTEAKDLCHSLGMPMVRAGTVGVHELFVSMIRELIQERMLGAEKRAIGQMPPNWDVCPVDCCLYQRPQRPQGQPANS